jgi:spermidine synthase
MMSTDRYDVVSIEISSVWFAGAADLYNQQFSRLVADHLAPRGVLQQWVQLHHLSRSDLAVILQSIRAELPHVVLFLVGRQGIVLAGKEPLTLDYPGLVALTAQLKGSSATAGLPAGDLLALSGTTLLDEAGVDALIREEAAGAHVPVDRFLSTDANLWLEYSTPRGNADPSLGTEQTLVESLAGLSRKPLPVTGADSPEAQAHLEAARHLATGDVTAAQSVLTAGPLNGASRALAAALPPPTP